MRARGFLALALLALCASPWILARSSPRIVYMDNWPGGQPKLRAVSVRTVDGVYVFDGEYRAFHADGSPQVEGLYRDGVEEGLWRWYDEQGRTIAQCDYRGGRGTYRSTHADGSPWWQGTMRRGKRVGPWEERDAQGRLRKQGVYVDGEPDGVWSYVDYPDSSLISDAYEGRWDRGDLLEDDGGVVRSPALRLGWAEHAIGAFLSLLCFVAPWPLAFCAVRGGGLAARWLAASVLVCTLWVGGALILGSVGWLGRGGLLAASVLAIAFGSWRGGLRRLREECFALLTLRASPLEAALLAAFGVWFAVAAWTLLLEPTVNFDSLAYHLPVLADWLQSGSLRAQAELGQVAWYAYSFELLSLLAMLALGGDGTAAWPNLFVLGVALLAVYAFARRQGLRRDLGLVVAGLLLAVPELARRCNAVQPDLALAAFLLAAFVLVDEEHSPLAFWGALALLASSKMSGLGYALLLLLICATRWRARWSWPGVGIAVGIGGSWLLRNLLLAGNPLGALAFGPWQGDVDVSALRAGSLARLLDPLQPGHWRIVGDAFASQLGWPALVLLLLALLYWRRDAWREGALLCGCALLYAFAPYSGDNGQNGYRLSPWMANNVRFALPAVFALSLLAARGLQRLGRSGPWLASVVVVGVAWQIASILAPLYVVLLVACAVAVGWSLLRSPRRRCAFALLLLVVALGFARDARTRRHSARLSLYGSAYEWCERRVAADAMIGILASERRYPWVGPRLRRPVRDVAPSPDESYADWAARVDGAGIDALIVGGPSSTGAQPWLLERWDEWAAREDFPFSRVGNYDSQKRDEALYLRMR